MDLNAIRNHCWWAIDDALHHEIDETTMTGLINQALADLASVLGVIKSAVLVFTAGVADLPADYYAPVGMYHGSKEMEQIHYLQEKVEDDYTTCQFFIPNTTEVYIFGKTPEEAVTLWYFARAATLTLDADVPTELPEEYHPLLAVYVRAMYALRCGRLSEYGGLMTIWETEVKRKLQAASTTDRWSDTGKIEVV